MLHIEIPQGVLYSISTLSCTTLCMYFSVERLLKAVLLYCRLWKAFKKLFIWIREIQRWHWCFIHLCVHNCAKGQHSLIVSFWLSVFDSCGRRTYCGRGSWFKERPEQMIQSRLSDDSSSAEERPTGILLACHGMVCCSAKASRHHLLWGKQPCTAWVRADSGSLLAQGRWWNYITLDASVCTPTMKPVINLFHWL